MNGNSLSDIPLNSLLENNISILLCTLGQINFTVDEIIAEVEKKSDYCHLDKKNRSLLGFFIGDSDAAVDTAIDIRQIFNSGQGGQVLISLHSGYITSIENIFNMINICSAINGISSEYGLSIGVSQNTFSSLSDPNTYNFRFTDRTDLIAVFDFIDGESKEAKLTKIESKSVFEDSVFNFYRNRYEEAVAGFRNSLLFNPEDKASFYYLKRAERELDQVKNKREY